MLLLLLLLLLMMMMMMMMMMMCWRGAAPSIGSTCEVSDVTTSSLLMSWSAAEGASYYEVAVNGYSYRTVDGNVTSLLVSGLQPGSRYTLSVSVYDNDQQRGNTVQAHVVTGNRDRTCYSWKLNYFTFSPSPQTRGHPYKL